MAWKGVNSHTQYTIPKKAPWAPKAVQSKLMGVLRYEFTLEESVAFLKPLTRNPYSRVFATEPFELWAPQPISGGDIKIIQKGIIKDLDLKNEYSAVAHLFFGNTNRDALVALKTSENYENALLLAKHVHNYVRHIYKIDMQRLGSPDRGEN